MRLDLFTLAMVAVCFLAAFRTHAHPVFADPPEYPFVPGFDRFFAPEDDESKIAEGGLLLLSELNCVSCHAAPAAWQERLPLRGKVSLAGVGSRLNEDDIWLFIRSPQHRKKGTLMPGMFAGEDRDPAVVEALTVYLASLKQSVKKFPQGDVERGRTLYHTVGCVACHEPADLKDYKPAEAPPNLDIERPGSPSVPLVFADRYDVASLAAFLQDPLSIRMHGRMPSTQMTDQEAADMAAYLHINREPINVQERALLALPRPSVAEGRKQFVLQRCTACHDLDEPTELRAASPLNALRADRGCLSLEKKVAVPDFGLSDFQRRALHSALPLVAKGAPPERTVLEKADGFLMRMNCYACHEWRGTGGMEEPRAQYLTVAEASAHSLGEIGRLPPKLDHAGRKLTEEWMEKLLWGTDGGVRPYMTARMPRFGRENGASFIPIFTEACRAEQPQTIDVSGLAKHHRAENGRT
ncbi:MAG: cytochrome c, partial [Roseimicrobium sp.]